MFLVTNRSKSEQVVIINRHEYRFKPHLPIELETISSSEMSILINVPMSIEKFSLENDESVIAAPVNETPTVQEVIVETPAVVEVKQELNDEIPVSDDVSISVREPSENAPVSKKDLRDFGRKKKG